MADGSAVVEDRRIAYFCDNPDCLLHVPLEDGRPWAAVCRGNGCCPELNDGIDHCSRCLMFDRTVSDVNGVVYCSGCEGDPTRSIRLSR